MVTFTCNINQQQGETMMSNQMTDKTNGNGAMTIRDMLMKHKEQLLLALPKHITADKMLRVALSEIGRNPALQECTQVSLFQCIITASQIGLFPDSLLGESYLVPFNNRKKGNREAQLLIGYKGLIKLAYQSNQVVNITAKEVYEKDTFKYQYGLHPDLIHIPASSERGNVIYYYAVARLANGGDAFEVMSRSDVEHHMTKYAKAFSSQSSPWQTQFDEMAKKTVIRKVLKLLPRSSENLMRAIAIDERAEITTQNELSFSDTVTFDASNDAAKQPESKADEVLGKLEEKPNSAGTNPNNDEFVKELG